MNFKELAYKSTGPILQVGGLAYIIKGFATANATEVYEGLTAMFGGIVLSGRTRYVSEKVGKLESRISELEQKVDGGN